MINLRQALTDPPSVFLTPEAVLFDSFLSREQKIDILKRWQSQIRGIFVAEDENMQGAESLNEDVLKTFESILSALHTLDAEIDSEHTPPTKQGG